MHIFDVSYLPPRQLASLPLREQPGWVTFSIDGTIAYPSTGDVFDTRTRKRIAGLSDEIGREVHSEKLLEIDFVGRIPIRNGDQFGLGRVAPTAPVAPKAPDKPAAIESPRASAKADPPALRDPFLANKKAPDSFRVRVDTSKGPFTLEVQRNWAPNGADRFYNLVEMDFYREARFFRVLKGFMAQIGLHSSPEIAEKWKNEEFPDDPVTKSNERGWVSFAATNRPNSRTTQFFINYRTNKYLDAIRFAPFARVVEGMDVVDKLYADYGEGAPRGRGAVPKPNRGRGQRLPRKELPQTRLDSFDDRPDSR